MEELGRSIGQARVPEPLKLQRRKYKLEGFREEPRRKRGRGRQWKQGGAIGRKVVSSVRTLDASLNNSQR